MKAIIRLEMELRLIDRHFDYSRDFSNNLLIKISTNSDFSNPIFSKTMSVKKISAEELRSMRWFGPDDLRSFGHRSRVKQMGLQLDEFKGKPVIGIINPWNEMNTCHTHFPQRVQDIKRGILEAGGFPVELPALSLGEQLMKPTTMMYRNFLAMETEELLRSYPIDGAVLMGGCDKTTPGVLMGAISMNLPSIYVPGGAMLRGHWRGETLGSGTDVWKYWAERRAGNLDEDSWNEIEDGIARSPGTCMTMGTAATMMSLAEALGMSLPEPPRSQQSMRPISACAPSAAGGL